MSSWFAIALAVGGLWFEMRRRRRERHLQDALVCAVQLPPDDLLMVADLSARRIVAVNHAFAAALGYTPAELAGRPYLGLVHPDDAAATAQASDDEPLAEDAGRFVNRYMHRDGHAVRLLWLGEQSYHRPGFYGFSVARVVADGESGDE